MKYRCITGVILMFVFFSNCAPKIRYNIPEDYPKARRDELVGILNKGKELYKANCSECHGIFTKGKDKIPNFTNTQIDNYSRRYITRDAKNHAAAIQMSPDQLNQVLGFLRYKRPKDPDSAAALYRKF